MLEFVIMISAILFAIFFIVKRYKSISAFTQRAKQFDPNLYRD